MQSAAYEYGHITQATSLVGLSVLIINVSHNVHLSPIHPSVCDKDRTTNHYTLY